MKKINQPLNEKEKIFVDEYCATLNKSRAYLKAYPRDNPKKGGYTSDAEEMISRPHVYAEIQKRLQASLDIEIAKAPNILLKYIEWFMNLDPSDYYNDDGSPVPMSQMTAEQRILISNINKMANPRTGDIILTYSLPDKSKLLDKLSDLVKFVAQVRTVLGDSLDLVGEAAKKRDEIFNKYRTKNVSSNYLIKDEPPQENPDITENAP